jgi:hypothetical protein
MSSGRSTVPTQPTRSNQRPQSQFNQVPAGDPRSRSPFSNQLSTNGQQGSSPFSNQGSGPGVTQQPGLGAGFAAGSGPTGGRVLASGFGNRSSAGTNRFQSNQQQGAGLGQGFAAGNGPTGGGGPTSGFSNPFSSNSDSSRPSTGRLGQGFSPGNGSTGGNRVPASRSYGATSQGINGFSPFGGRGNQASTTGSQGTGPAGGNSQQQGQQRNGGDRSSPFGSSPGGATAGFSPFGSRATINGGSSGMSPTPGARFGSNGSPPGRQQQQQRGQQRYAGGGGINGATINGAGVNGAGGRVNGARGGINGASQQQSPFSSGLGFNNNPSDPLTPPGGNDFERRRAQELEQARREGIEEARREEQRRRQANRGAFGQSGGNSMSGSSLDKALLNAIRASDEGYKPPQAILDAPTIGPLLEQVDGPNLYQYDETEKTYSGRAVKVMGESSVDIPIRISTPGSIVEYTIEKKSYDFNLGITAKLDQGGTAIVKVSTAR